MFDATFLRNGFRNNPTTKLDQSRAADGSLSAASLKKRAALDAFIRDSVERGNVRNMSNMMIGARTLIAPCVQQK